MIETRDWLGQVRPDHRYMALIYLHGDVIDDAGAVGPEPNEEVIEQVRAYRDRVTANPTELLKHLGMDPFARTKT
jgi:hypothetical protein